MEAAPEVAAEPEVDAGVREEARVEELGAPGEGPEEVRAEPEAPEVQARVEAEKAGPEARVAQAVAGPAAVGVILRLQSIRITTTIR